MKSGLKAFEILKKQPWLRRLQYPVGLAIVALMSWTLYNSRSEILSGLSRTNWGWLGLAGLLNLAGSLVYLQVWTNSAHQLGSRKGIRGSLVALSVAGAARYVPGAIWPVAGLVYFAPQIGLSRRMVPLLAAIAQLLHLAAAGLVGGLSAEIMLVLLPDSPGGPLVVGLIFSLVLCLTAIAGLPRYILKPLLQKFFKLEAPPVRFNPFPASVYSAGFWVINGLRLACLGLAFGSIPLSPQALLYLISAGAATTLLAALFFFVPLGLGVIEVSLSTWLSLLWPWPVVLVVVTFNRVLRTLNDLFFLAVAWFLYRKPAQPENENSLRSAEISVADPENRPVQEHSGIYK